MKIDKSERFRRACYIFQMEEYIGAYECGSRETPTLYDWQFLCTIYDDVLNFEIYMDEFGAYHYLAYIRTPNISHIYHY